MTWVKKGLTEGKRKTGGRNNTGRITAFHRGGGNKARLRKVESNRSLVDATQVSPISGQQYGSAISILSDRGSVKEIVRVPNHTGYLALIHWESRTRACKAVSSAYAVVDKDLGELANSLYYGQHGSLSLVSRGGAQQLVECKSKSAFNESFSYILAPEGLKVGDKITGSFAPEVSLECRVVYAAGNAYPLAKLMAGTRVFNVDGKYARAAGCSAEVISESRNGLVNLKLQSGQVKSLSDKCIATIGSVSNPEHKNKKYHKAGEIRWLGRRPHVRGVAMNPVDHPHGGGEGKTSGGRPSVTPWGLPGKGRKTRRVK